MGLAFVTAIFVAFRRHLMAPVVNHVLMASHANREVEAFLASHFPALAVRSRSRAGIQVRYRAVLLVFRLLWPDRARFADALSTVRASRLAQLCWHLAGVAVLASVPEDDPNFWRVAVVDGDVSAKRALILHVAECLSRTVCLYIPTRVSRVLPFKSEVLITQDLRCLADLEHPPQEVILVSPHPRRRPTFEPDMIHVGVFTDRFVFKDAWLSCLAVLLRHPRVSCVYVRQHPRCKLRIPFSMRKSSLVITDRFEDLGEAAKRINFAIVSATSTAHKLTKLGVKCFRLPGLNPEVDPRGSQECISEPLFQFISKLRADDLIPVESENYSLRETDAKVRADVRCALSEHLLQGDDAPTCSQK